MLHCVVVLPINCHNSGKKFFIEKVSHHEPTCSVVASLNPTWNVRQTPSPITHLVIHTAWTGPNLDEANVYDALLLLGELPQLQQFSLVLDAPNASDNLLVGDSTIHMPHLTCVRVAGSAMLLHEFLRCVVVAPEHDAQFKLLHLAEQINQQICVELLETLPVQVGRWVRNHAGAQGIEGSEVILEHNCILADILPRPGKYHYFRLSFEDKTSTRFMIPCAQNLFQALREQMSYSISCSVTVLSSL